MTYDILNRTFDTRPSWDEYFMQAAFLSGTRSTCLRRQVGAVAVRGRHMLCTGYNGAPSGMEHCRLAGCIRKAQDIPSGQRHELCRGLHAEQNVIIQAAVHGISLVDATLYVVIQPCSICAKMLINCGFSRIVMPEGAKYDDDLSRQMLDQSRIRFDCLPVSREAYA